MVDFQFNYALIADSIKTHWAFPPLTCAGSAGMEELSSTGGYSIWPEFRQNKLQYNICNRFFNVTSMESYLEFRVQM